MKKEGYIVQGETINLITMQDNRANKLSLLKATRDLTLGLFIICFILTLVLLRIRVEKHRYYVDSVYSIQEGYQLNYDEGKLWSVKESDSNKIYFGLRPSLLDNDSWINNLFLKNDGIRLDGDYSTFVINDENIEKLFRDIIKNYDENIDTEDLF